MRKFFTLTLAAAAVMSVSAQQIPVLPLHSSGDRIKESVQHFQNPVQQPDAKFLDIKENAKSILPLNLSRSDMDLILDPQGESTFCKVITEGFSYNYYYGLFWTNSKMGKEYVKTDTELYLKDPVSDMITGAFIKGSLNGDIATFTFPQLIDIYDYNGTNIYYYATLMEQYTFEEDGTTYISYQEVTDIPNEVTYTVKDDGTISLNLETAEYDEQGNVVSYPQYILSCIYNFEGEEDTYWAYCGDALSEWTPYDYTKDLVQVPEDVVYEEWIMLNDYSSPITVNIGIEGDNIYIKGLTSYLPDAVVKGIITEDKATFESGQLMGYLPQYDYFMYFVITDMDWATNYSEIVFNYDSAEKILSVDNDTYTIVLSTYDNVSSGLYYDYIMNPYFYVEEPGLENANPLNPEYYYYIDYTDYDGSIGLIWILPQFNVDGGVMNPENEYFNFYINGEKFIFYDDEYFLGEDMIDVPLNIDSYDLKTSSSLAEIYVYTEGIETVGMQLFLKGTDGKLYASDLVTYSLDGELLSTSSIESAITENSINKSEYFNLAGVRVANPSTGIYVKRNVMNDGSVKVQKVAIR